MFCLSKRADISANCIWGANLAALTTWPFNPSIRCGSAGNTSAHRAAYNHKGNGHMPLATARDVGEQYLPAKPTAKPPELMYKRLTTLPTSTSGGSPSSHPNEEEHASTTDHQHESKTNVVCRRTNDTENCPPTRCMHTKSFNILEPTTDTCLTTWTNHGFATCLGAKRRNTSNGFVLQASSKHTRCPKLNF